MIIQHPNGNSYIFAENKMFVSTATADNRVVTVEINVHGELTDWEREQLEKLPMHECADIACEHAGQDIVPFGKILCEDCKAFLDFVSNSNHP